MQNVSWSSGQFRRSWILYCPRGLWVSMRHHVQVDRQLVSAIDTGRHPVRSPVLMGCLALRRSWKIDAISLAYLPSRAVGVAAPPSFFGSPAHWRPLASQMFACNQLKTFRHPCVDRVSSFLYVHRDKFPSLVVGATESVHRRHSCWATETGTMMFLASGGASDSVHRQCGGHSCCSHWPSFLVDDLFFHEPCTGANCFVEVWEGNQDLQD